MGFDDVDVRRGVWVPWPTVDTWALFAMAGGPAKSSRWRGIEGDVADIVICDSVLGPRCSSPRLS